MKRLDNYIRQLARDDWSCGGGLYVPRSSVGILFRYLYLWALLPVWAPLALLFRALSALGKRV